VAKFLYAVEGGIGRGEGVAMNNEVIKRKSGLPRGLGKEAVLKFVARGRKGDSIPMS